MMRKLWLVLQLLAPAPDFLNRPSYSHNTSLCRNVMQCKKQKKGLIPETVMLASEATTSRLISYPDGG
jgi:hypothetical protein